MASSYVDTISATLIEKDLIKVTFIEKEIVSVKFNVVDVLNYVEKHIVSGIIQEVPTKLSSVRFETSHTYVTGSIKFFLNGIKEKQSGITEISSTIFEISQAILIDDDYEIEYVELV